MNNIDQNTDFETRSLDTICINESHLEHKWYHNIKYLIVGLLFGIVFIKAEISVGSAFKKCSVFNPFTCMVLLVVLLWE
jgi:hypothetical protein